MAERVVPKHASEGGDHARHLIEGAVLHVELRHHPAIEVRDHEQDCPHLAGERGRDARCTGEGATRIGETGVDGQELGTPEIEFRLVVAHAHSIRLTTESR